MTQERQNTYHVCSGVFSAIEVALCCVPFSVPLHLVLCAGGGILRVGQLFFFHIVIFCPVSEDFSKFSFGNSGIIPIFASERCLR